MKQTIFPTEWESALTLHEPNRTGRAGAIVALAMLLFLAAPPVRAEDKKPTSQPVVTDDIPGSTVSIEMVSIPAGDFKPDKGDAVKVKPLYMSKTEITWDAYNIFA